MLKNVDREKIADRLRQENRGMTEDLSFRLADQLIRDGDERLSENVNQWLRDELLSSIWIGDYCVGMVMKIWGSRDVAGAVLALSAYAEDPEKNLPLIWRVRR